jgi:hypothetical protein
MIILLSCYNIYYYYYLTKTSLGVARVWDSVPQFSNFGDRVRDRVRHKVEGWVGKGGGDGRVVSPDGLSFSGRRGGGGGVSNIEKEIERDRSRCVCVCVCVYKGMSGIVGGRVMCVRACVCGVRACARARGGRNVSSRAEIVFHNNNNNTTFLSPSL